MAPSLKGVFPTFALKQLGPYIAFIVIFVHNVVLDKDLQCSCDKEYDHCCIYMILPFFILFILQLWIDKTFQRFLKYTCVCTCGGQADGGKADGGQADGRCRGLCRRCWNKCEECWNKCKECWNSCRWHFFWVLLYRIIKAVVIGLLWVVAVYIDGDWYVCCQNYKSKQYPNLACKDKEKNITLEERKVIAELKGRSLKIGLWILFGLVVAALLSLLRCYCKHSDCCKENLYYGVILEEEEGVMKEILITAAKERLTETFQDEPHSDKWKECLQVAEGLINGKRKPTVAESQLQTRQHSHPQEDQQDEQQDQQEDQSQTAQNPFLGNNKR